MFMDCDDHIHVATKVTFHGRSTAIGMDTRIILPGKGQEVDKESRTTNFLRRYGWSITSFHTAPFLSDYLAVLLDDVTQTHGSRLTHLVLMPYTLTTLGLEAMDQIIKRSTKLVYLWLYFINLEKESLPGQAILLLERYGEKLNKLTLVGDSIGSWLPQLAKAFPSRSRFPLLGELTVHCYSKHEFPRECVQWLASMVSIPHQPPGSSSSSAADDCRSGTLQRMVKSSAKTKGLTRLQLSGVTLPPQDWETVIRALDISALKMLFVFGTNFSLEHLDLLLECISRLNTMAVPLELLNVADTKMTEIPVNADKQAIRARILQVAPRVAIQGLYRN